MAYGVRDLDEFRARLAELRSGLKAPTAPVRYVAYTDGACFGNPEGPGGWAAAVFPPDEAPPWYLFGHLSSTSNNRAEALGLLAALEWVPPTSELELHSDSELTVRLFQRVYKVKANTDIWELIFSTLQAKRLQVSVHWVRGHAGDPLNELADQLSKLGALNGRIEALGQAPSAPAVERPPAELAGLEPRSDWEREFLSSVAQQLRRGRPLSPKQQVIVDRIRARVR